MKIVYLSKRPFSDMVEEGFRARRGKVIKGLIETERVRSLTYVLVEEERGRRSNADDGRYLEKVRLERLSRIGLPCVRSFALLYRLDGLLKRRRLAAFLRKLEHSNSGPSILWTHDPRLLKIVPEERSGKRVVVCDLIDDFRAHPHLRPKQLREYREAYERLDGKRELIFTVGRRAAEELQNRGIEATWIPNGVDWELFHSTIASPPPEPEDLRNLPHPRVGFIGILSKLTDHELLNEVARRLPTGCVVVVGRWIKEPGELDDRIRCLGFKPAEEVYRYAAHIDIGLSIYGNFQICQMADAIKVYEYLAAGKPVVATMTPPNVGRFEYVRVCRSREEFVERVLELAGSYSQEDAKRRAPVISESVRDCSWRMRVDEMLDVVEERMKLEGINARE